MLLGLELFGIITAFELLLWLMPSLKWRRVCALFISSALLIDSILILYSHLSLPTILLAVMNLYRICNMLRLRKAQINVHYLRRATIQCSLWIILIQAVLLISWRLDIILNISTYHLWLVVIYIDLLGMFILLSTVTRQLMKTRPPISATMNLSDREYPTLTVAIPARNETDDLDQCLKSLITSNYPKLEIVVLDDCSQNKHTPEIIRDFAQDGVMFIQGDSPEDNWLAKNFAYQRLFDESNGELILFCGVDVRFQPDSLRQLVGSMLQKQKSMMSVIPKNIIKHDKTNRDSILFQPIRYAWELALPRKLIHRPAVLSTCWIIKREVLESAGGFGAVSRSIIPESYFARVSATHDGYSFMQSNNNVAITSHKNVAEQRATFIRTRYPQLHRRMELVMFVTILEAFGFLLPYTLIVIALVGHLSEQLFIVSLLCVITLTLIYAQVVYLTYRRWFSRSLLLPPLLTLIDVILLNYSMIRYEFSSVLWKGRNICIPIMHVNNVQPSDIRS